MYARRCFSQNFLCDAEVAERIIAAAALRREEEAFEIGPGHGALTWRMLPLCRALHVVEIDRELLAELEQRRTEGLIIHAGDALKMDWAEFLTPPCTMVANLPYNISSPIFFRILEKRKLFRRLVLMFQKEFGERLCALPGSRDYGAPSVLCRQYFDAQIVMEAPPRAFRPAPKVTSVVVALTPLEQPRVAVEDERRFAAVVRGAFTQRRKTLLNSLRGAGFAEEGLVQKLEEAGIDPRRRGETLTLEEFAALTHCFER
ncbi:MAG: ribosomal RNA small subunit methyltransferase A [Deltaproteobacteria bacterium]|nr:ribosomal RNA small subunit methyltransferase A [Deltaproteobacteria bacterium]